MATNDTQASPTQTLPPPGWYPDPEGTGQRYWDGARWAPPTPPPTPPDATPPSRPADAARQGRFVALAVLIGLLLVGSVGYVAVVRPMQQHKSDAKAALRDTRPIVDRSIVVSRRAQRDASRAISRGAKSRRVAIAELNQVISLRKRAVAKLAVVATLDFPRDRVYKRAAKTWSDVLRSSMNAARDIRGSLTDKQLIQPNPIARQALATIVVGQNLFMEKWDRLLRSTDTKIIAELV